MIVEKGKIIFALLFFSKVIFGQISTKVDTILCHRTVGWNKIIIEYPTVNRIFVNYAEGALLMTINSMLDTATIVIHCGGGGIMARPLTDSLIREEKTILSEFVLEGQVRIVRGYYIRNGRRKYFREDNYFEARIDFVYKNVEADKLMYYERFFNNVKILRNRQTCTAGAGLQPVPFTAK